MSLIIVESPGKTKKIEQYAGSGYVVKASVGHVIDLPPKKLGVDVDNDFEPEYDDIERQKKTIADLARAIKKADKVILAADLDREGEMIAWSLAHRFKLKKPQRITFDAITKDKIQHALKNPRGINYDLVNAQKARRILDRLIGYKLSPLVQKHVNYQARSAGRVQSVVVKLIIEKENEIKSFFDKTEASFYKIGGEFFIKDKDNTYKTSLQNKGKLVDGYYNGIVLKEEDNKKVEELMKKFSSSIFKVSNVGIKDTTSNPSPPFTTSTMLQEATSKLGMSSTTVKQSSQKLYNKSFITYIRTDTTALSGEAMGKLKGFVVGKFGDTYYKARNTSAKGKTQEAHEAIRPTNLNLEQLPNNKDLTDVDKRLYNLIWRRTVASQMAAAKYKKHIVQITASKEKDHFFEFSYDQLVFPGYMKVYFPDFQKKMEERELPEKGDTVSPTIIEATEEYNRPPTRFTEASLINKLDPKNLNIGRPSTYNTIISKIVDREYVEITDVEGVTKNSNILTLDFSKKSSPSIETTAKEIKIGEEKKKFKPTELGIMTNQYLVDSFPKIMDYEFTAGMEDSLDDIAAGDKDWKKVLSGFWKEFKPMLDKQAKAKPNVDKFTKSLGKHPNGNEIIARMGRYGPMLEMVTPKGKNISAPIKKPLTLDSITMKDAIKIFEYPKSLGKIGKAEAFLNKGKFGLYVKYGPNNISIPKDTKESDINIELVEKLIEERNKKFLATFKDDDKQYQVLEGPYGKYIRVTDLKSKTKKPKTSNVKLPEGTTIDELDIEKIKTIIDDYYKNRFKKRTTPKTGDKDGKDATKPAQRGGKTAGRGRGRGKTTKTTSKTRVTRISTRGRGKGRGRGQK